MKKSSSIYGILKQRDHNENVRKRLSRRRPKGWPGDWLLTAGLTGIATAISIVIALSMIYTGGLVNFNSAGEGWFELIFTVIFAAAGYIKLYRSLM